MQMGTDLNQWGRSAIIHMQSTMPCINISKIRVRCTHRAAAGEMLNFDSTQMSPSPFMRMREKATGAASAHQSYPILSISANQAEKHYNLLVGTG